MGVTRCDDRLNSFVYHLHCYLCWHLLVIMLPAVLKKLFIYLFVPAVSKHHRVKIGILGVILMRQKQKRHVHLVEISSANKVISLSGQRLKSEIYIFILFLPYDLNAF